MRYVKPQYFDNFRCIADKCPDSCCEGWQIVVDEESLERYVEAGYQDKLDRREGCFLQHNGRCAFLNERNLCNLVIERGDDWLCDTCARYPRHEEDFDGVREWSLSLSCPVAAEMILKQKEPLQFLISEDEEEDPLAEEFEDFDLLLFTYLEDARAVMFRIVQNRKLPMVQRMGYVLEMARKLQECVDEQRLYDMEEVIWQYEGELSHIRLEEGRERFERLRKGFSVFWNLERLRDEWTDVLEDSARVLYDGGYEQYQAIYTEFMQKVQEDEQMKEHLEIMEEQLMMFFLYTYFCGAVYDDWIYSKAALAVFSVCYLQEFIMCRWYMTDKHIEIKDCIELAYRYAREVEHSDDNLELLEEWLC